MSLHLIATTELQAINSMLSTIGEAPVNDTDSGLVDAEIAETVLSEVSRSVQSVGWNFNSEPDVTVAHITTEGASDENYVKLDANVLRADLANTETKYRSSKDEYVQRGVYMYNKVKHTKAIGKSLKLDLVKFLDFTDLPEVARRYITIKASRLFQERIVGSENLSAMNRADEDDALVALKEMEGENGDYNIFDDRSTYSVLDRSIGTRVT
jgi:hypothetical protein